MRVNLLKASYSPTLCNVIKVRDFFKMGVRSNSTRPGLLHKLVNCDNFLQDFSN